MIAMVGIYVVAYFGIRWFLPFFFRQPSANTDLRAWRSVALITVLSSTVFYLSSIIPDLALSNRFLHAIGGGFLAMLVCFLASRDSSIKISKFQLISISFLVTTFLGVGNELAEFALQSITGFPFTDSLTDTWLDLTSNTVGALLCALCLVPFFGRSKT
jgi:uncharacterized membrane protein YhaH (DUF805 family)